MYGARRAIARKIARRTTPKSACRSASTYVRIHPHTPARMPPLVSATST
jgi:hypothetical protein